LPFMTDTPELGAVTIARGGEPTLDDIRSAAWYAQYYNGMATSKENSLDDAYNRRIDQVFEATGVKLVNPRRRWPNQDEAAAFDADVAKAGHAMTFQPWAEQRFHTALADLANQHPSLTGVIRADVPIEDDAAGIRGDAERKLGDLRSRRPGWDSFGAQTWGGLEESMVDPVNLALLPVGLINETKSILWNSLRMGALTAGASAAQQPWLQAWRKEAGLESGIVPAVSDVAMGFAGGFALEGLIRGGVRTAKRGLGKSVPFDVHANLIDAAGKLADDNPLKAASTGDLKSLVTAGQGLEAHLDEPGRGALAALQHELALREVPDDIDVGEHLSRVADALRHAADPETAPAPRPADPVKPARAIGLADDLPARAKPGEAFDIEGLAVTRERWLPVKGLKADDAGLRDPAPALGPVWHEGAARRMVVFEGKDGARTVLDGQRRLKLAQALPEGHGPEALDAYLFREADGWDIGEVRQLAARKNLDELRLGPVEAARALRQYPDIVDKGLPLSTNVLRQARGLARLPDHVFERVAAGEADPHLAARIGEVIEQPAEHAAVLDEAMRRGVRTPAELDRLLAEHQQTPQKTQPLAPHDTPEPQSAEAMKLVADRETRFYAERQSAAQPRLSIWDAPPRMKEPAITKMPEIMAWMADFKDKLPKGVNLLLDRTVSEELRPTYDGFWDTTQKLMYVALYADDPVGVARHEHVHMLRHLGFISDADWRILRAEAVRIDARGRYSIMAKYAQFSAKYSHPDIYLDMIREEEVAFMRMDWGNGARFGREAETIFGRIKEQLERVQNFLLGQGFRNVGDVFHDMEHGRLKARPENVPHVDDLPMYFVDETYKGQNTTAAAERDRALEEAGNAYLDTVHQIESNRSASKAAASDRVTAAAAERQQTASVLGRRLVDETADREAVKSKLVDKQAHHLGKFNDQIRELNAAYKQRLDKLEGRYAGQKTRVQRELDHYAKGPDLEAIKRIHKTLDAELDVVHAEAQQNILKGDPDWLLKRTEAEAAARRSAHGLMSMAKSRLSVLEQKLSELTSAERREMLELAFAKKIERDRIIADAPDYAEQIGKIDAATAAHVGDVKQRLDVLEGKLRSAEDAKPVEHAAADTFHDDALAKAKADYEAALAAADKAHDAARRQAEAGLADRRNKALTERGEALKQRLANDFGLPKEDATELTDALEKAIVELQRTMSETEAKRLALIQTAKAIEIESFERKRRALLTMDVRKKLKEQMEWHRNGRGEADVASAMIAVLEHFGPEGNGITSSVEGRRKALLGMAHNRMQDMLWEFRRTAVSGRRMNPARLDNMVKELFGRDTGDEAAKGMAKAWTATANELRMRFNAAGGSIGHRNDWGMPQWHDRRRIMKMGMQAWRDFTIERLNPDEMKSPLTGKTMNTEELELSLEHVWQTIVSEGWNTHEATMLPKGLGKLWNRHQDPRFLVFKNADSWLEYQKEFGGPDPFQTMMRHVNVMARDIAALEVLGPDPRGMLNWMVGTVQQESRRSLAGMKASFPQVHPGTGSKIKDTSYADSAVYQANAMWEHMRGSLNVPVNSWAAEIMDTAVGLTVASSLGAATLTAVVSDTVTQHLARVYAGGGSKTALKNMAFGLSKVAASIVGQMGKLARQEAIDAGLGMQSALHVMGTEARSFGRISGPAWSQYLADRVLTLNGLTPWTNASRHAFGADVFSNAARDAEKAWGAIDPDFRKLLERYNIREGDWDKLRQTPIYTTVGGARHLRPTDVADRALGERYLEMTLMETEYAVPTGSVRSKAFFTGTTRSGTLMGSLARSAAMFRSYGMMMALLHGGRVTRAWQRGDRAFSAQYAAKLIAGSIFGGAIALQLRALKNGQDPRPMADPRFVGAALLQGGGLGIMGDFFFSNVNRFGSGFASTLAGPVVGKGSDLWDLTGGNALLAAGDAAVGNEFGTSTKISSRLSNVLRSDIPGVGAWPVSLVLNRMVFDQLQILTDPHASRSFGARKRAAKREGKTDYWWGPGSMAPERGPDWRNLLRTPKEWSASFGPTG
jgi:hypothetical protein